MYRVQRSKSEVQLRYALRVMQQEEYQLSVCEFRQDSITATTTNT